MRSRLAIILLIAGFSAGCGSSDAPGKRQISCTASGKPAAAHSLILELDLGRHEVRRLSAGGHAAWPLEISRYDFRFLDPAGNEVTIGRYDGRMRLQHARLDGRRKVVEDWTCGSQKLGPAF